MSSYRSCVGLVDTGYFKRSGHAQSDVKSSHDNLQKTTDDLHSKAMKSQQNRYPHLRNRDPRLPWLVLVLQLQENKRLVL